MRPERLRPGPLTHGRVDALFGQVEELSKLSSFTAVYPIIIDQTWCGQVISFDTNALFNDPLTITGDVTFEGDVTFDEEIEVSFEGPVTFVDIIIEGDIVLEGDITITGDLTIVGNFYPTINVDVFPPFTPGIGLYPTWWNAWGMWWWDGDEWHLIAGKECCIKCVKVKGDTLGDTYTIADGILTADNDGAIGTIDGVTLDVGDRILFDSGDEDTGVYEVTDLGDGSSPFVLTFVPGSNHHCTLVVVLAGTEFVNSGWVLGDVILWVWSQQWKFPHAITVRKNTGGNIGQRQRFNFIEGSNVTLTIADDGAAEEIDITIAAAGAAVGANYPGWVKVTKGHADFTDGDTAQDIEIYSLPAKGVIHGAFIKHSASFTGGAISAWTLSVGYSSSPNEFTDNLDAFAAPADTGAGFKQSRAADNLPRAINFGAATSIRLYANSSGGNVADATAGSVEVWLCLATLP